MPWRRTWQPSPVFLPGVAPGTEEPGGLQSMGLEIDMTEWLRTARHTCVSPLPVEPASHHPHPSPLGHSRALSWCLRATEQHPTSCLFSLWWCNVSVLRNLPTLSSLTVSTGLFPTSTSIFLPYKEVHHIIFLDPITRVSIWRLFFSFWVTSLFELWFYQGICPVVGLLSHMVVLFLVS